MSADMFGRCGETEVLDVGIRSGDGLSARILSWGAVLRSLTVPGRDGPRQVVLGFDRLEPYLRQPGYLGAVVGRYANRIAGARFPLDGEEVRLVPNEGRHILHGGPDGFGNRLWTLVAHDRCSAHLALVSEAGDMGFPGRVHALASYEVREPATLRISFQAFSDQPTPLNLTTHSYYNLDGSPDIRDHRLQVMAGYITPVDAELIPTGEIRSVSGTAFDFRQARALRSEAGQDYDINYVLARRGRGELEHAATLASDVSGIAMELWTTEPGLQLYDGHKLAVIERGLGGAVYSRYAGLALEPQLFPDSPHHPHFPDAILRPGIVSRQVSELRFRPADRG